MKYSVPFLCFATCFLSAFAVETIKETYARQWSWADPVGALLALVCLWQIGHGRWRIDRTAAFMIASVVALGVSASVNAAWRNGTLLNFGRTATFGAVLYIAMFNTVRNERDLKRFTELCVALVGVLYAVIIPNFSTAWSGEFSNVFFTFGFIDLNSFGFACVLLFSASSPLWLETGSLLRSSVAAAIAFGALVSFSRSAWTNLLIVVLLSLLLRGDSRSPGSRIMRALFLLVGLAAAGFVLGAVAERYPGAAQFGITKWATYGDDLRVTRVGEITLEPLAEWTHQSAGTLLVGDSISNQHNFIVNALWTTGVLGLVCVLGVYGSIFMTALRGLSDKSRSRSRLVAGCLLPLVIVMFLDDTITNHRYYSQFVSYLFSISAGAFAGYLRPVNRKSFILQSRHGYRDKAVGVGTLHATDWPLTQVPNRRI